MITDPNESYFKDGLWGWLSTKWYKLPLLFGYSDRVVGQMFTETAGAGDNTLTGTVVPAGEIWVIQAICASDITSNTTRIYVRAWGGALPMVIADEYVVTAGHWVTMQAEMLLKEGDYITAFFVGCTAGDDLYLRWWGYKMAITQ